MSIQPAWQQRLDCFGPPIVVGPSRAALTSDAGLLPLRQFDEHIGLDRIVLVHLNDTRAGLASRTDRHEHLGAGRIGPTGLGHVLRHPGLVHAPAIIETPGMDVGYDAINLDRARALLAGRVLDPLPAEAFDLAGSARGRIAASG